MGKILQYIAQETQGECFTSFKYCYDNMATPHIEYEAGESSYKNLKDYAEDVRDPKSRDMTERARICQQGPPLFKYFLEQNNLDPNTCIAFGNEYCDRLAANNANIEAYDCLWGATDYNRNLMQQHSFCIENPNQIISLLN